MKILLLSLTVLISVVSYSQRLVLDTLSSSKFIVKPISTFMYNNNNDNYIIYGSDSSVIVKGDTILVIKSLIEFYMKLNKRYWEAREILERINLMSLYNLYYKKDSEFLKTINIYLKNKNNL